MSNLEAALDKTLEKLGELTNQDVTSKITYSNGNVRYLLSEDLNGYMNPDNVPSGFYVSKIEYTSTKVSGIYDAASSNSTLFRDTSYIINNRLTDVSSDTFRKLGNYSFYACQALSNVYFPNISSIGSYCFSLTTAMRRLDLPKCKLINNQAFSNSSISSLEIVDDSALSMDVVLTSNALQGSKLKYIHIPELRWIEDTAPNTTDLVLDFRGRKGDGNVRSAPSITNNTKLKGIQNLSILFDESSNWISAFMRNTVWNPLSASFIQL